MYLGMLNLSRKNRAGTAVCKTCNEAINPGSLQFVIVRKFAKNKGSVYAYERIHLNCVRVWAESMLKVYHKKECARVEKMGGPKARPATGALTPTQLIDRTAMMKRRSYLINRVLTEHITGLARVAMMGEVSALKATIDSIAPYNPFATKKRTARSLTPVPLIDK